MNIITMETHNYEFGQQCETVVRAIVKSLCTKNKYSFQELYGESHNIDKIIKSLKFLF